jgi:hypothetical protein
MFRYYTLIITLKLVLLNVQVKIHQSLMIHLLIIYLNNVFKPVLMDLYLNYRQ